MDSTNDIGTYIMLMSMAKSEDEHLFPPGAEFEVGNIIPKIITDRSRERRLKIDQNKDVEAQLQKRDDDLSKNLVYVIELFKEP